MNLPVLYRVDQPTSNVVVFRGAQVALARQSGLLAPTSQSASGFRAKSRAASTYAPTSTSTARARHDEPQQRTYTFPFPRSEATGHRKVSNDEYQDRYYNVSERGLAAMLCTPGGQFDRHKFCPENWPKIFYSYCLE